jgi:HTH-type transcriptional regulator/antitoxin HigA
VITNERQYKITKAQVGRLHESIKEFDLQETANRIGSATLAKAELNALKSEAEILESQLAEYEELKSGVITTFHARSLAELPGVLIRARIAQGLSQRGLGELVGLKEQQIQRYESEMYASASLMRLREIADALRLDITEIGEVSPIGSPKDTPIKERALEWTKFPLKEMYKRGWFEGFSGSMKELVLGADEVVHDFVVSASKRPTLALHRQRVRAGSEIDFYALLAWECRIRILATKTENVAAYRAELLTSDWLRALIKLSSSIDGPIQARSMLAEAGIALVIEPPLPSTYLDGAAMIVGNLPIIGMTLRFDRLDNFWFVLLHELIHITYHLKKGKLEQIFDDLDAEGKDEIEQEADRLAGELLIPAEEWDHALARYMRTVDSIKKLASELGINSAIIAGRIRRDADNYTILNDLVGYGEVRKQFPKINFGV